VHPQVDIAPSILAANFARLGDDIQAVERAGVRMIHVDVMDGHFVPNISIGVPVVASLRKATRLLLDVHLMIENPERYVEPFAKAGADTLLIHQEATAHLDRVVTSVREHGCRAGVSDQPGDARVYPGRHPLQGRSGVGHVRQSGIWRPGISAAIH